MRANGIPLIVTVVEARDGDVAARRRLAEIVARLIAGLQADDVWHTASRTPAAAPGLDDVRDWVLQGLLEYDRRIGDTPGNIAAAVSAGAAPRWHLNRITILRRLARLAKAGSRAAPPASLTAFCEAWMAENMVREKVDLPATLVGLARCGNAAARDLLAVQMLRCLKKLPLAARDYGWFGGEDVIQAVVPAVLAKLGTIKSCKCFEGWLRKAAINHLLDELRKPHEVIVSPVAPDGDELTWSLVNEVDFRASPPAEWLEKREMVPLFRRAIGQAATMLKPQCQAAFAAWMAGRSGVEMAALLGINGVAVSRLLRAAWNGMRDRLRTGDSEIYEIFGLVLAAPAMEQRFACVLPLLRKLGAARKALEQAGNELADALRALGAKDSHAAAAATKSLPMLEANVRKARALVQQAEADLALAVKDANARCARAKRVLQLWLDGGEESEIFEAVRLPKREDLGYVLRDGWEALRESLAGASECQS